MIDQFQFKLSERLNQMSNYEYKNIVFTAKAIYEELYLIFWEEDQRIEVNYYESLTVKEAIDNGDWIVQ